MFRKLAFAALAATSLVAAPAFAASPAVGTWATSIQVQDSTIESTMTIAEAAGGYSIDIKDGPMPGAPADAPAMQSTISDVAVDGGKVTFKRALTTPQGPMNLAYSVTADGDKLTGQINSDFGAIPLTGTRK